MPPVWYTDLVAKCESKPDKKHILYIENITNVDPDVQSLFYPIMLNRSLYNGIRTLPENCVVVAKDADSEYYYPIPEQINKNFSHIYYDENTKDFDYELDDE